MAVSKSKKVEILEKLKEILKEAKSVGFTENVGLTMTDLNAIRKNLREVGGTFILAKKTLIKIAMKEVFNVEIDENKLTGQVAVVTSTSDAVAGLGKVNAAMKEITADKGKENKIKWILSYFEGAIQDEAATKEIASMPTRETLLSRLVGSMQSPIAGLARFFDAAAKKLETENMANLSSSPAPKKEAPVAPAVEEKAEAPAPVEIAQEPAATEEPQAETPVAEAQKTEEAAPAQEEKTEEAPVEEVKTEETLAEATEEEKKAE